MESYLDLGAREVPETPALLPAPATALCIVPAPAGASVRLSLVIPTYNERRNLEELLSRLSRVLEGCLPGVHEMIVVDDDSPDRTWELAARLSARYPALRVIRRRGERGLSTAVIRGWQAARGQVLAVIDADLQHPPELIAALWAEVARGADLVVGSRHTEGGGLGAWSLHRRALSSGARLLGRLLLPSVIGRLSDPMSGCFMVRRSAIAGRLLDPVGYKILIEVLARGSVKEVREVGYVFDVRREGESKVTFRVYLDYVAHLLRLRLRPGGPLRFARFALAGASGVVVDMGLLFVLSDPSMLGWNLTAGKLVAAEVAIVNNFFWNDTFAFRDLARRTGGLSGRAGRFLRWNAICGAGLALHVGLLHLQIGQLGLNRYLANAIAIALVAAWNYWLALRFAWRSPSPPPATARDADRRRAAA